MSNQDMDAQKFDAEISNLNATTAKLLAETAKINKEAKFYPYVVAGGFGGVVVAIITVLPKFLA